MSILGQQDLKHLLRDVRRIADALETLAKHADLKEHRLQAYNMEGADDGDSRVMGASG